MIIHPLASRLDRFFVLFQWVAPFTTSVTVKKTERPKPGAFIHGQTRLGIVWILHVGQSGKCSQFLLPQPKGSENAQFDLSNGPSGII
jgi:hypothetical protein